MVESAKMKAGTSRSAGYQGGRRYRLRYVEGFADGYSFQPYAVDPQTNEWGPVGDAVTLSFPTIAIRNAHPQPDVGPVTAQYPDLASPGQSGGTSAGYTLAYRTPTGEYAPIMMPTDRIP